MTLRRSIPGGHATFDPRAPADPLALREWLVTNGIGGYACGTFTGAVTRRYHGLLVASLPAPLGRTMMLNHLAELVVLPTGEALRLDAQPDPDAQRGRGSGADVKPAPALAPLTEFRLEEGL